MEHGEFSGRYSFFVRSLWVSGIAVPTHGGDLVVVVRQSGEFDWELVYTSSRVWQVTPSVYDLDMHGPEGEFTGSAVLVRSDGRSHVFRGSGALSGIPQ